MRLLIKVVPKARRNALEAADAAAGYDLRVFVSVVPEKGKANQSVVKLLAKHFNVPKSKVRILRGESSTIKLVEVEGVENL